MQREKNLLEGENKKGRQSIVVFDLPTTAGVSYKSFQSPIPFFPSNRFNISSRSWIASSSFRSPYNRLFSLLIEIQRFYKQTLNRVHFYLSLRMLLGNGECDTDRAKLCIPPPNDPESVEERNVDEEWEDGNPTFNPS